MEFLAAPAMSRALGQSGLTVSGLAWGMWRFAGQDVATAQALVEAALSSGITLFDTADIYGCDTAGGFGSAEALLGDVFAAAPELRSQMILASKGGIVLGTPYDSSASYIASAIDVSLMRMKTDHINLWQVHRPDILTHPAELAKSLQDALQAGKIGAIGLSNVTIAQASALMAYLDAPLASHQPEFSPLCLDPISDGLLDQAMAHDIAVLAWSPLGGGRIADPQTPRDVAVAAALDAVALTQHVSRTAAAYSWIMAHPARPIPIIGSQQPARIAEAADAYKVKWTRADWYAVLVASREEPLP